MKKYNKNIESSCMQYLDANNLHGWAMSQKIPVNEFKWVKQEELSKINDDFIKNYDENGNTGYFLEVDIDYPKELFDFHKDLPFLSESKKVNKVEKLICDIDDKKKICYSHKSFKTSIKSRIKTKKVTQNTPI